MTFTFLNGDQKEYFMTCENYIEFEVQDPKVSFIEKSPCSFMYSSDSVLQ